MDSKCLHRRILQTLCLNNLQESEQHLVARYIGVLKETIQEKLELNSVWFLSQAVNFAFKAELQQSRPNKLNNPK